MNNMIVFPLIGTILTNTPDNTSSYLILTHHKLSLDVFVFASLLDTFYLAICSFQMCHLSYVEVFSERNHPFLSKWRIQKSRNFTIYGN